MAKHRLRANRRSDAAVQPRRSLANDEVLQGAIDLIEDEEYEEANEILTVLAQDHSTDVRVLELLVDCSSELGDSFKVQLACYKLCELKPGVERYVHVYASACEHNVYPALALRAFEHLADRWPSSPDIEEVRGSIVRLRAIVDEEALDYDCPAADRRTLEAFQEEVEWLLEEGEYKRARRVADSLLERQPKFVPALGNKAIALASDGLFAEAIEIGLSAHKIEPDNASNLSVLVMHLFQSGQVERAAEYAKRFSGCRAKSLESALWAVKALSLVGDDNGVLDEVLRAPIKEQPAVAVAELMHFAAVATCRLGKPTVAKRTWQKALKLDPDLDVASLNLEDLSRRLGERHGPFSLSLAAMIGVRASRAAMQVVVLAQTDSAQLINQACKSMLRENPQLVYLAPVIFDRCDPMAVWLIALVADETGDPALLGHLKQFALGMHGTDNARRKALFVAGKHSGVRLEPVRFYSKGKWKTIPGYTCDIYDDAQPSTMTEEVYALYEESMLRLNDGDYTEAESLLRSAIGLDTGEPVLLNNLATVLDLQGRRADADLLLEQVHLQHPDYLFGRCNFASVLARSGRLDEANTMLEPVMKADRLHRSEYAALCGAKIEIGIIAKDVEHVDTWAELLRSVDPDNPALESVAIQVLRGFKSHEERYNTPARQRAAENRRKSAKKPTSTSEPNASLSLDL